MRSFPVFLGSLQAIYMTDPKYTFDYVNLINPNKIIIHHTGNRDKSLEDAYYIGIEKFEQPSYHFIIDGDGNIFQTLPINIKGAHCKKYNASSIGISLLNLSHSKPPTLRMKYALHNLVEYVKSEFQITEIKTHLEILIENINDVILRCNLHNEFGRITPTQLKDLSVIGIEEFKSELILKVKTLELDTLVEIMMIETISKLKNCPSWRYEELM